MALIISSLDVTIPEEVLKMIGKIVPNELSPHLRQILLFKGFLYWPGSLQLLPDENIDAMQDFIRNNLYVILANADVQTYLDTTPGSNNYILSPPRTNDPCSKLFNRPLLRSRRKVEGGITTRRFSSHNHTSEVGLDAVEEHPPRANLIEESMNDNSSSASSRSASSIPSTPSSSSGSLVASITTLPLTIGGLTSLQAEVDPGSRNTYVSFLDPGISPGASPDSHNLYDLRGQY
ncbi:hypothetical protein QAD02_000420 [Eretmocerus hayati]|uniref:Uncharacterized protein n=1 Tax=Eretmocerus hayati TaxID=131215 RepID=A0ACC2NEW3_9HYME|nr:hypothetical protein QAD02_000420 [Eretmocerus hayati]